MKIAITTILLCSYSFYAYGQIVDRLNNETAEQFAERQQPKDTYIVHKVIEITWNKKPVIIAFYNFSDLAHADDTKIAGVLYEKISDNNYCKMIIDTFRVEGGAPVIESVFFSNANKDQYQELIISCSWNQNHWHFGGTLYETYIYNNNIVIPAEHQLKLLQPLSEQLSGGCECVEVNDEGQIIHRTKAKYRTAKQIKAKLRQLGY